MGTSVDIRNELPALWELGISESLRAPLEELWRIAIAPR